MPYFSRPRATPPYRSLCPFGHDRGPLSARSWVCVLRASLAARQTQRAPLLHSLDKAKLLRACYVYLSLVATVDTTVLLYLCCKLLNIIRGHYRL